MDDRVTIHREWFKDYKFHLINSIEELQRLVSICIKKGICSLDTETTGVDNRIYSDEFFDDGIVTRNGIRTIDRVVGVCISFDGVNGYYIPLSHEPEDSGNLAWDPAWDELTRLVDNCRIIFHNKKFDAEFIMPLVGREYWKLSQFEDTMLMAKVISPLKSSPAGLKPLSKQLFGVDMIEIDELFTDEKKEQLQRQKQRYNFSLLHPREGLEYGCSDGIFTYKLYFALVERLKGYEKIYDIERSFCNIMREMERNRVHTDVTRVTQLYEECKTALQQTGDIVRSIIESKTGKTGKWRSLNVGSASQLSDALFTDQEGIKLKPIQDMFGMGDGGSFDNDSSDSDEDDGDGKEKTYSLKDEIMKALHRHYGSKFLHKREVSDGEPKAESIFELILEYRHYEKMKGSYIEKLFQSHDKYGDVRPSFNQMGTDTTRLSCKADKIENGYSGVNFQGIPRDSDDDKPELFKQIRTVIIPRPGWVLVKIDYSGEELRVITNMSGDPLWAESFLHKDGDVHSITARILYEKSEISKDERNRGKRSNFAIIYGGGAGAISRNVGCSIEDGGRHMENMRSGLPVLMGYVEHQKKFAHKHKCIYTAFGRRIPIPTIDSPIRAIQKKAERCAINYTIQATSADILKLAMCYVDKQLRKLGWKDRVRYVLTVHDEVVFEIKPEYLMEIVRKLDEWMTTPWRLPKVHGKQWMVPLETEPGIDIHWRARFDYFAMVDGKKPDPKDLDSDGSYKGKLKKDQYFADGRIYQKIPDFLESYIWRLTPAQSDIIKQAQLEGIPWEMPTSSASSASTPSVIIQDISPILVSENSSDSKNISQDSISIQSESSISVSDLNLDDISLDTTVLSTESEIESIDIGASTDSIPESSDASSSVKPEITDVITAASDEGAILRWVFKAVPSKDTVRKLKAVCTLAEGNVPLRVMNLKGQILIPESIGTKVHPQKFQFLASLFGLG
jgi:DNA polymerase I-like protein with 3'-5' exonuclease and polymerase domains